MRVLCLLCLGLALSSPSLAYDMQDVPEEERPDLPEGFTVSARHDGLPKDVAGFIKKSRKLLEQQKLVSLFHFALHPRELEQLPSVEESVLVFRRDMGELWTAFVLAPEVPCYTIEHPEEGEMIYLVFRHVMNDGPGEMALQKHEGKWKIRDI